MEIAGYVRCPHCHQLTPVTLADLEAAAGNPVVECVTPGCEVYGERTQINITEHWEGDTVAA